MIRSTSSTSAIVAASLCSYQTTSIRRLSTVVYRWRSLSIIHTLAPLASSHFCYWTANKLSSSSILILTGWSQILSFSVACNTVWDRKWRVDRYVLWVVWRCTWSSLSPSPRPGSETHSATSVTWNSAAQLFNETLLSTVVIKIRARQLFKPTVVDNLVLSNRNRSFWIVDMEKNGQDHR